MTIAPTMRLLAIFTIASTVGLTIAQDQYTSPSTNATLIDDEIAQISTCGLSCLQGTIPAAGCSLLNTTCQCESTELMATTSSCMLANCTLADTFVLSKIQAAVCGGPYETRNPEARILTVVCTAISNTAVILRLATRYFLHQPMGRDDWFILAAVIADAGFVYCSIQVENNGFGEHIWNINLTAIPNLFYWFYLLELLYGLTLDLVKVSILLFYLRVFPVKSVRLASWAMIAYCVANTVAFSLATIFQCEPIAYAWDKDIQGGRCINYKAVAWAYAAINIQQDIFIIVLPISALRKLQLRLKRKIGMYAMFSVGSFVCLTAIIRLNSLRTFGLTADPTWDNVPTAFWSTLQTTTAIFCACMPAIRAGLVRLFSRVMSTAPRTYTANVRSTADGSQQGAGGASSLGLNTDTAPSLASWAQAGPVSIIFPAVSPRKVSSLDGYKSDRKETGIASRFSFSTVNEEEHNSEGETSGRASISWDNTSRTALAGNFGTEMPQRPTLISIFNPVRIQEDDSLDMAKPLPPLPLTPCPLNTAYSSIV